MGQSSFFPSANPPPAPAPSTSRGFFPDDTEDPLRQALTTGADEAARLFELRTKTGLAPSLIERHKDEIERDVRAADFDSERYRSTPKLKSWLADPVAAAAARDDLQTLQGLEHALTFGDAVLRGYNLVKGELGGTFPEALAHLAGRPDVARTFQRAGEQANSEAALYGRRMSVTEIRSASDLGQYLKETAGEQIPMMAPSILGGLAGGPTTWGALIGAGLPSFAQNTGDVQGSVDQARVAQPGENKIGDKQSARATAAVFLGGSAIAALDTALPGRVGARLMRTFGEQTAEQIAEQALAAPIKAKWLTATAKGFITGAATEGFTEALQEAVEGIAAAAGTGTALDWRQVGAQMLEAGAAGAVMGGAAEGATGALEARHARARAAAAEQQQAFFEALGTGVSESKLAQRLPAAMQEFLHHATKDGPLEHVYAPVDTFEAYWQRQGVNPAIVAQELTGSATAFEEAKALGPGGLLQIPTSVYAAKIATTDHHTFFAKELKLDPHVMNAREVDEFEQRLEAFADDEQTDETPATGSAAAAIYARTYDQSIAAGQTPDVADFHGRLYARRYTVQAERLGIDPMALFEQQPPSAITSTGPASSIDTEPLTIPPSVASPNETGAQRSTRRTAQLAALTNVLLRDAHRLDPSVTRETIARALDQRFELQDEQLSARHESGGGRELLAAIAENGGLWFNPRTEQYRGEIERLALEGGEDNRSSRRARAGIGRESYSTGRTWNGVAGVFKEGGKYLDSMVEALREDPRFRGIEDINALLDQVETAMHAAADVDQFPGTNELIDLNIDPRERWWEDGAPRSWSEFEQGLFDDVDGDVVPFVDTLDTGEQQPRLPGAEIVREQEIATPEFDAPFALTSEVSKAKKGKQESLFQRPPITREDVEAFAQSVKDTIGRELAEFDVRLLSSGDLELETMAVARGAANQGVGTRAMQQLTRFADRHGLRILLSPANRGFQPITGGPKTTSTARLEQFYRRFGFVKNAGQHKDFSTRNTMLRNPRGFHAEEARAAAAVVIDSSGKRVAATEAGQAAFARWFAGSAVVDAAGRPLVVYHGTSRLDRMGPRLRAKRATSGPMPFFTASAEIASRYADQKPDTSLANEDVHMYESWFRLKSGRSQVNLPRAWYHLTPDERARVAALAPRVMQNDEGQIILGDEGHDSGTGGYDQHILEARGNHFAALIEEWLNSANLYDDEARFFEVLKLAGAPVDRIAMHDPNATYPGVLPVYLAIKHPLDTAAITDTVIDALEARAKRTRKTPQQSGADFWDKARRDIAEWVAQLKEDRASGTNSFVWSSIPDPITDELKRLGYDGIVDTGGKMGGAEHVVYVPFSPGQVKSAIGNRGTFDPDSDNLLYQGAYHGSRYKFDAFDLSKIGSGEGAQVYGWGLYFASQKDVATWYRDKLAGKPVPKRLAFKGEAVWDDGALRGQSLTDQLDYWLADKGPHKRTYAWPVLTALDDRGVNLARVRRGLVELHSRTYYTPAGQLGQVREALERTIVNLTRAVADNDGSYAPAYLTEHKERIADTRRRLEDAGDALYAITELGADLDILPAEKPGRLYHVDIPDHDTFLDWDKPLVEQPAQVRTALLGAGLASRFSNEHTAAARQQLLVDVREEAARRGLDPDGQVAAAEKFIEQWTDPEKFTEADWQAFSQNYPDRLKGRMHDLAKFGLDNTYIDRLADTLQHDAALAKLADFLDRMDNAPSFGIRVVDEGEDPDYPFEVREGAWSSRELGELVDAWSTREEAEQQAQAYEDIAAAKWEREMLTQIENNLDADEYLRAARVAVGLDADPGWGFINARAVPTGESLYQQLVGEKGDDESASRYLAGLGINGVRYLDGSSRGAGEGSHNYVLFRDDAIRILEYEQREELAAGGDDVKGAFNPATRTIRLVAGKADLSTFLHESGHAFLEELVSDAIAVGGLEGERTPMQQQLRADAATVLQWFGFEGTLEEWRALPVDARRAQHEQFARGFEAYLMEGKAPSLELRDVFARFRAWLVSIYRNLRALRVEISPEIRGVMDRLLATDDEIAAVEAEADFPPALGEDEGFLAPSLVDYQKRREDARRAAVEDVDRRLLDEFQRERSAWWQLERERMRAIVVAEKMQQPAFVAQAVIRTGKMPDGSIPPFGDGRPIKLSKADLIATFGPELLPKLPKPYLYAIEGGLPAETVAELTGFPNADALIQSLLTTPRIDKVIEQETDARMREQHGDSRVDEGGATPPVREVAEGAVHAARLDVVLEELRLLNSKAAGAKVALPTRELLDASARTRIARTRFRELRPGLFLVSAQRAGMRAFELAGAGQYSEAVKAKQQEAFALALYRAARDAKEQAQAWRTELVAYDTNSGTRARIGRAGQAYLDQIDGFLERYEFTRVTHKTLDRRESLRAFVARQERLGIPIDIPDDVLDDARQLNWQELTIEELEGVRDAVTQIAHLARLKNKLLKAAKARELAEVATEMATSIRDRGRTRVVGHETRLPSQQAGKLLEGASAAHRKIASLARELDGFRDGGPVWDYIIRPLNDAADREATLQADATGRLMQLVDRYSPAERARWFRPQHLAALGDAADPKASLSKSARLMVALNWGNEANRQRMRDGRGWTDDQVQAILETLDRKDWEFVQGVWDFIDSFWPAIKAKQERVVGVAPAKVDAVPVFTRFGEFRGGYFPLRYEGELSSRAGSHEEGEFANIAMMAAYVGSTTRRGHTKERAEGPVKEPVRLDLGVITEHVGQVIHDLAYHEALVDVNRLLKHEDVDAAIRATQGDAVLRQFKNTFRDVAQGTVPARDMMEKLVNHLRTGSTVVGMGWRFTTALMQPLGFTQSAVRIGPRWVARGLTSWFGHPTRMRAKVREIHEKSPFMRTRALTLNREINEIRNQVGLDTGRLSGWVDEALRTVTADRLTKHAIAESYFSMIHFTQTFVDVPTWLGAYEKAMVDRANVLEDGTVDEARAIALADQAVIDSQGAGAVKDLASVQRGSAYLKLFTNFYSYFNVTYNLWTEAYRQGKQDRSAAAVGRLAVDYLLLFAVPATVGVLIRDGLRGEDDPDQWISHLWRENVSYPLSTFMIGREVAGGVEGFDYSGPAGSRFTANLTRFVKDASRAAEEGDAGKFTTGGLRAGLDAVGAALHIPTGQVRASLEGLAAYLEGRSENPAAIIVGP